MTKETNIGLLPNLVGIRLDFLFHEASNFNGRVWFHGAVFIYERTNQVDTSYSLFESSPRVTELSVFPFRSRFAEPGTYCMHADAKVNFNVVGDLTGASMKVRDPQISSQQRGGSAEYLQGVGRNN